MGGKSKSSTPSTPATTPVSQPMQTVQPAMPGQLNMLAQQLGAGFGQSQPDMLAYLQQFYQPMQVPDFSQRGFVPPVATPDPKATGKPAKGMGRRV